MHRGYIKLWRKIKDWDWYDDNNTLSAFLKMLLMANWQDKQWHGITVKRGQFISSYNNLSQSLNLSYKAVRIVLDKLKRTGEVAHEAAPSYGLFTIVKYEDYQSDEEKGALEGALEGASEGQARGRLGATTKEVKEVNNNTTTPPKPNKIWESITDFCTAYKHRTGAEYTIVKKRDCALVKQLQDGGADRLIIQDCLRKFFSPDNKFIGNCDVPSFFKAFNRLKMPDTI